MLPGDDDAGTYLFDRTSRCNVGNWTQKVVQRRRGFSNRELIWGIDNCRIDPLGFNREIANPFADAATSTFGGDRNPVLNAINLDPTSPGFGAAARGGADGIPNATALPFRPGTECAALPATRRTRPAARRTGHSQGIFMPNLATRKAIRSGDASTPSSRTIAQNDLQWNRGASQEPWKELRELYVDFEAFESRLWVRVGKQTIVWGKTELFRNQDQWNPVDIAIGPLASLEESRIALLGAARASGRSTRSDRSRTCGSSWCALFDQFEPTDIGRCGEPFVPRVACDKSYGLWVHGENGTGVAGERRPEDPWNSASGIETVRGSSSAGTASASRSPTTTASTDLPYMSLMFQYSRNVDPVSGRPRNIRT